MVGFPLLLIPLAVYNIIVFLMPSVSLAEPVLRLTLMSGAERPVNLNDMLAGARHFPAAAGSHQGRPSRREISHRSPALAGRVRRRRGRVFAVAAVRHLDLLPAGDACAGGFPVRHRVARAARNASCPAPRSPGEAQTACPAAAPEPQFDPAPAPAVPPAASVAESVPLRPVAAESRATRRHAE